MPTSPDSMLAGAYEWPFLGVLHCFMYHVLISKIIDHFVAASSHKKAGSCALPRNKYLGICRLTLLFLRPAESLPTAALRFVLSPICSKCEERVRLLREVNNSSVGPQT